MTEKLNEEMFLKLKQKGKDMKRNIAKRIALVALGLSVLLTGCSDDKELDFLYTVGIEDYHYTGSSLFGPMGYLSGLDIADRFTITAEKESDADAQAKARFDAEMNKIDPAGLDASAAGGTYSFRYVLRPVGVEAQPLAERTFSDR